MVSSVPIESKGGGGRGNTSSPSGERVESYAASAKRNTRTDLSVKITNKTPIMRVLNRRTRARCRGLISGIGKYY